MSVVRLGATELIIRKISLGNPRARRSDAARAVGQVLHLPATTIVTHVDVKLAIRAETNHAAIVIAPWCLTRIFLKCAEVDEIRVLGEDGAVPDELIDPIAQ